MEGIVLSWQIEDIRNEDLYKDEIKEIPDEFQSVGDYLESYTLPLIEETRAELFSGLETISVAPCARIRHIALRDTIHGLDCKMDILADGFSGGADMYEPKNGDVFILSSLKPESINDLLRYGITYCLAIVKKVVEFELDEVVVKKVLSRNQMESICDNTHEQNNPEMTRVLEQILSIDLNQSQLEVVKSTISAVQCNESSSIELVWGPPGTGKTKTVGSVLWSLKQFKIRTLTCAPTNVAVLGVCSRLVHLLKNFEGKNGDSDGTPISLADVVLFGNRRIMDVVGDLEDVFLDNRINRLENCFIPNTSWRCRVASMIRLLEDCISMYDVFECKEDQKVSLSFGDYLREQFKEREKSLSSCFQTLFVHLPRRFLSSENCTSILSLQDLLRQLDEMLSGSVITDEQLKQTFGAPPFSEFSVQEKLIDSREECLKQLRNLQETLTLSLSSLTNDGSIRDFCIQNATLVFCTASSSFLLHDSQVSCFDVVVIDEAA